MVDWLEDHVTGADVQTRLEEAVPVVNPSTMGTWYTNEAFWRETYPFTFSEDAFRRGAEEVDRALALLGGEPRRVLDLACGPGRHAVPLALRGLNVTGVDLSPFMLQRAHERAAAAAVSPEFVLADMRAFARPDAFDVVFNLGTSFGYFETPDDDRRVLTNVARSLRPGGAVLIHVLGREIAARGWVIRVEELSDGSVWVQRPRVIDEWTRMTHDDMVISNGSVHRFTFSYRLYAGQELRQLLMQAGFVDVSLFGDLDGRPYGPGANRLVAVGKTPL